jgi:hypothetical protein
MEVLQKPQPVGQVTVDFVRRFHLFSLKKITHKESCAVQQNLALPKE